MIFGGKLPAWMRTSAVETRWKSRAPLALFPIFRQRISRRGKCHRFLFQSVSNNIGSQYLYALLNDCSQRQGRDHRRRSLIKSRRCGRVFFFREQFRHEGRSVCIRLPPKLFSIFPSCRRFFFASKKATKDATRHSSTSSFTIY